MRPRGWWLPWARDVTKFRPGDRVMAFHHIPCLDCFYCQRKLYAQCPVYKKVGITAGFEPAGGGFAQYVRVMDWIVERGVEKIPGRHFVRTRHAGGAAEHLSEGGGAVRSPAGGYCVGHGPGTDRPDVHHAGEPHGRAHGGHRYDANALHSPATAARKLRWIRATTDIAAEAKKLTTGAAPI